MQGALEKLAQRNHELETENAALRARVADLEQGMERMNRKLQHVLKQLFGRKTETLDPRQLELLLSGLSESALPVLSFPNPRASAPSQRPRAARKPRIPENLPTEDIVLDPDEVTADPTAFRCIGQEITQELDVVPPKYLHRRFIRRKYVSKADRSLSPIIAPLPRRLMAGGYASVGLVTDIAVKKFVDHLPLYRQEQALKQRYNIEISRKTMCDWLGQLAWWLKPIYSHIRDMLRGGGYMQIDESPIRYCRAEGGGSGQGYVWVYNRPGVGVLYEWHTSRAATCLNGMLDSFSGTVQSDGYSAYRCYARERARQIAAGEATEAIELAGCWAHARRKFRDALPECPGQAGWVLGQIQHLYRVEAALREGKAGPALRVAVRAAQSAMILARLEKALKLKLTAHRPTSQMGKAIAYALPRWQELTRFIEDGRLEIDNNLVENAVRPTALGKKNWLFVGSADAGERAAIIYTLLENCRREGINPEEYLRDVLTRLPMMSNQDDIAELTPANWAARRRKAVA